MSKTIEELIRIHPGEDLQFYDFPHGSCVMLMPAEANWIKTSATGRWIFEKLLEQPRTLGDIVQEVADHYGLPEQAVAPSVEALVAELCANGLATRGVRSPESQHRPQILEEQPLQELWFNITARCNLRCQHCYDPHASAAGERIELATARELIDQAAAMGVTHLVLSGGEPTLHPHLEEIVRHAERAGRLDIKLVTNGTKSDMAYWDRILPQLDNIQVSLDGLSAPTNDAIRGEGVYQRATELMSHIRRHFPELLSGISFTPLRGNVGEIPRLYELAQALGARYIHLNRPKLPGARLLDAPAGDGLTHEDRLFCSALDEFDKLAESVAKDAVKSVGMARKEIPELDRGFDPGLQLLSPMRVSRCAAGVLNICVNHTGDCFPCAALIAPDHACGNIHEDSLSTIYERMRHRMEEAFDVERDPECRACDFRSFCGGGCRATAGGLAERDRACGILKQRFVRVLGSIGLPKGGKRRDAEDADEPQDGTPAWASLRLHCE